MLAERDHGRTFDRDRGRAGCRDVRRERQALAEPGVHGRDVGARDGERQQALVGATMQGRCRRHHRGRVDREVGSRRSSPPGARRARGPCQSDVASQPSTLPTIRATPATAIVRRGAAVGPTVAKRMRGREPGGRLLHRVELAERRASDGAVARRRAGRRRTRRGGARPRSRRRRRARRRRTRRAGAGARGTGGVTSTPASSAALAPHEPALGRLPSSSARSKRAAARQPRHHRPERAVQDVGDLAVAEALDVLQIDRRAVRLGELASAVADLLRPAPVDEQQLDAVGRRVGGEERTLGLETPRSRSSRRRRETSSFRRIVKSQARTLVSGR